jgi:hypothetical protein
MRKSICFSFSESVQALSVKYVFSGHKSPAAFMRYIKVDNQQAAKRLKELRAKLAR